MAKKLTGNLTPHFHLAELTHSAVGVRHGLLNQPEEQTVANLTRLAENILEPVRAHFNIPFSPSSGYRSLEINRLVGSKSTSQHITGQAVDFEIVTIPNRVLVDWIRGNLVFDQLILEFHQANNPHSGWVHCSYVAGSNRQQSFIFNGTDFKEL